jgi:hypothetical protein
MFNARRYADGLLEVQNATSVLPASMHKDLLRWKVVFQSRLGKNVEAEMLRVGDYPKETQADVWLALGLQSRSRYDQLIARQKAVDVLAGRPWVQAEFLLGLGEWLLLNEGEAMHGREVLLGAADLLLALDGVNVQSGLVPEDSDDLATSPLRSSRKSYGGETPTAGGRSSMAGETSRDLLNRRASYAGDNAATSGTIRGGNGGEGGAAAAGALGGGLGRQRSVSPQRLSKTMSKGLPDRE